jgi:two-component system response regulator DesR
MIRTLIAEQTSLIRAGLVASLSCAGDIDVIAELRRGDQVVSASLALRPDVAVLAAALPGADGFAAARALHAELPSCRSLIMGDQRDPAGLRRAVAAHATGFVARDVAPEFMAEAVRRVARGKKVIDPELAFAALNTAKNPLTARELDALRLAAEGATTAEIARDLCLSVGTVRNYLSRTITKTGGRNRVDAIRIALGAGWL